MNVIKEFWAKAGSVTMPDGVTIPFWGFAPAPDRVPQLSGPTIEAKVGDNVQITLHNTLAEPVSIIFPGQDIIPEPVKDEKNIIVSFTRHAFPYGGTVVYSFRAVRPGTYLYESGSSPEKQVQMGLYGVLIIRPADYYPAAGTRTAYGIGSGTEYDVEKIIVTGELDSALHSKIAAGLPYEMLDFAPDYFTINGRAYPDTLSPDNRSSQPHGAAIKITSGKRVLLRCANAGFLTHSLHISGGFFRVVAGDGTALKTFSIDATYEKTTITIGSGQVYDLIFVAVIPGEIYLYDRELRCTVNAGQFPGGIMTRIEIAPGRTY
ncbi:MAG: multicopper oxidase domain-containing protein [Desulfocucumaceae bacterium]